MDDIKDARQAFSKAMTAMIDAHLAYVRALRTTSLQYLSPGGFLRDIGTLDVKAAAGIGKTHFLLNSPYAADAIFMSNDMMLRHLSFGVAPLAKISNIYELERNAKNRRLDRARFIFVDEPKYIRMHEGSIDRFYDLAGRFKSMELIVVLRNQ